MTDKEIHQTKRRTVWILTYLPPNFGSGGVERFVMNLAAALQSAGHDVKIIDSSSGRSKGSGIGGLRPLRAWQLGEKVNKMSSDDDVIICNGYFSWNAKRRKSVVIYHGTELGRALATRSTASPLRNLAVRIVNSRLDRRAGEGRFVVTVSSITRDEVERLYGLRVDAVIPNGIDLEKFRPATDKRRLREELGLPMEKFLILYAGPPDARKGYSFLIDEVRPRLKSTQNLILTTETDSPLTGVIPVGRIGFDDISRYYQACDAFVMPSLYEGCSFALAEALACGLPSVVSSAGSAADMLADEILAKNVVTGLDSSAYVSRLTALEESVEERRLASEASRHFAERHFDIRDFNREYINLVNSLARRGDA